ncbi:MAG: dihydrofolate reductase [Ruminococcus sp.]|nr:dihydrofolate reductase [Ruminococcus sp.]
MNIISAVDLNWGIGKGNDLLFDIPEDKSYFRETTLNKTVIMGRKTFQSLPFGALPKRRNIILSTCHTIENNNIEVCRSPDDLFKLVADTHDDDLFVIGGQEIYSLFLPFCDTAYITKIYADGDADKYIMNFDTSSEWELDYKSDLFFYDNISFDFNIYKRI